jgi:hypothetical protein
MKYHSLILNLRWRPYLTDLLDTFSRRLVAGELHNLVVIDRKGNVQLRRMAAPARLHKRILDLCIHVPPHLGAKEHGIILNLIRECSPSK